MKYFNLYEEFQFSVKQGNEILDLEEDLDYDGLESKADKDFIIGNFYTCIDDYVEYSDVVSEKDQEGKKKDDIGKIILYEKGKKYELTHKEKNSTWLELGFDNNSCWVKGGCIFAFFDNKPV